ncbi:serine/threonine-protein kinase BLUS1 isoform X2 [Argentina anserina]|uniref:serine/threonine-protein kinase BLUS1 isoform X2 n=1 Tax=Argentina anserina TaxID=57926 RepID=UPI0021768833|nr:serine/threonine-protein kinase BLUS1 isoform X2 [Potentilla anserina]
MEQVSEKRFPLDAKEYKLYEEVGEGVSASVHRALCIPLNEIVAIKVLDLEKCNNDLDGIRREVHTMTLINHQNLLRAHCSFTAGHSLWVVMPYMAGGSCLHIMKSKFSEGFDEPVIATLLHEVLKALVYLHAHGHIHRDVKAGNILIDSNGAVKLADFGVSACMFDTGDRQRSRNTFVGTPCWMAPEVMLQLHGYDFKADIWSFGITALELAHGHAPFSKYPPMKVLLMTIQNASPGLDYERDKRFSKSFRDLVAVCLEKDPKKRPTSEKLLKNHFFKHARPVDYLSRTILANLEPLGERFRKLKQEEADVLVQNKALYGDKEHLSQQEYIRGISAWNFSLEDLKNQAALIQDDGTPPEGNKEQSDSYEHVSFPAERSCDEMTNQSNFVSNQEDGFDDLHNLDSSLASFPMKPLQALKGCFDVIEEDVTATSTPPTVKENGRGGGETSGESSSLPQHDISEPKKFMSGSLLLDNMLSSNKVIGEGERDHPQSKHQPERKYSGPLLYRQRRDANTPTCEDMSEGAVVQRKGRFKVTAGDVSPKGPSNSFFNPVPGGSSSPPTPNVTAGSVLSILQSMLQQNASQREELIKLIKFVEQIVGMHGESADLSTSDLLQIPPASYRERELQSLVINSQQGIRNLEEQIQRLKIKNAQLERQLNAALANKNKM